MTTLTDTLTLPGWVGDDMGAHVTYGRRELSWRIHHPEGITLHRCTLVWGWFTVTEERMWRGEPLRFSGERRTTENGPREWFTDKARKALADELVPAVARFGFDRLWMATHRATKATSGGNVARSEADRHQREAAWWADKAQLMDLYETGLLEFVPVPPTPVGEREFKVETAAPHGYHSGFQSVAARALLDGDHVGWMTADGDVIPVGYPQRKD